MIVKLVDRVKSLLDIHPDMSAVLATAVNWVAAFDKVYLTSAIL